MCLGKWRTNNSEHCGNEECSAWRSISLTALGTRSLEWKIDKLESMLTIWPLNSEPVLTVLLFLNISRRVNIWSVRFAGVASAGFVWEPSEMDISNVGNTTNIAGRLLKLKNYDLIVIIKDNLVIKLIDMDFLFIGHRRINLKVYQALGV